MAQLKIFLN